MSDMPVFVLEREFDAPRELVWQAWTDPELLSQWYGPRVDTIIHQFDIEEGGIWLNEMKWDGKSNYQRAEFTEVNPPERLVFMQSSTDDEWNIVANPMMPDWPRVLTTIVTFDAKGEKTKMRLEWVPHDASQAELDCFAAAMEGLGKGWGAGMDLLAELLAKLTSK